MKINIKQVDQNSFDVDNLSYFIDTIFNNFKYLYDYPYVIHSKQEILRLLTSPNFHGYLIYYKKYIIGYLVGELIPVQNKLMYFINYIYVSPKFRDHKLGTKLMNKAFKYAKSKKADGLALITDIEDEKSVRFYSRLKFSLDEDMKKNQKFDVLTVYFNDEYHNYY